MIRTAICEDDARTRAYLASLIRTQPYSCEIAEYAFAEDCLSDCGGMDIIFLDIGLGSSGPIPDGMALAREIRTRTSPTRPVIIFVTGYDQYVFDAFDVGAFQYLLKPVDEAKFAQVFLRAAAQIQAERENPQKIPTLTVQASGLCRAIPLDTICYIESSNHKVVLHLKDGEFAYYAKIRDLEAELRGPFFRIHKGYLVNLAYIVGYTKTDVALRNGETLLLSKYKYQDFVKAYLRFLKKGTGL